MEISTINRHQLTIIILTHSEGVRLIPLLEQAKSLSDSVFVVDSFSDEATVEILKSHQITFLQNPFTDYASQRNWAQEHNPFESEFVLHLDADEVLSEEFVEWIKNSWTPHPEVNGYLIKRCPVFLNREIRSYTNFQLRLFRRGLGRCESKLYDQHFIVEGRVEPITHGEIRSVVSPSIDEFISSHNRWSTLEAIDLATRGSRGEVSPKLSGTPIEQTRWLKLNLYDRSPLFLRAFFYFFYRYFIRGGFLEGYEGLIFHVLQAFWFRFIVDAKLYHLRTLEKSNRNSIGE